MGPGNVEAARCGAAVKGVAMWCVMRYRGTWSQRVEQLGASGVDLHARCTQGRCTLRLASDMMDAALQCSDACCPQLACLLLCPLRENL